MEWLTITIRCFCRYWEYVWDGLKTRWKSRNTTGLFGLVKGFFKTFFEAFALTKIDLKEGYLS